MTPLLLALSVVGALAVVMFVVFLVVGAAKGWKNPAARRILLAAYALGIVCAVLGVAVAFIGG